MSKRGFSVLTVSGGRMLQLRSRVRRSFGAFLGVACCLALAACNANPSPAPLPSKSPSPTVSPRPSPTTAPPTMPAAAKGSSEAAAEAFVRYWIETLNYAGPSGDTQRLSELSHKSCSACGAVVDFIDQVHVNGGYIKGNGWSVRAIDVVTFQPPRRPMWRRRRTAGRAAGSR
jgi:hypothetical protein